MKEGEREKARERKTARTSDGIDSERPEREKEEGENDSRPLKPAAYPAIRTPHGSENLLS